MKMSYKLKIITSALLLFVLILSFATTGLAVENSDLNDESKTGSIAVNYVVKDAEFEIYQIADVTDTGAVYYPEVMKYINMLTNDFKGFDNNLANQLCGYLRADENIKPLMQNFTDEHNTCIFDNLSKGVYLIAGYNSYVDKYIYMPEAMVVSLPYIDDLGEEHYIVDAEAKYSSVFKDNKDISLSVLKVWDDKGYAKRPETVTIGLLRNSDVYEIVDLNDSNKWQYTWDGLDVNDTWSIIELIVPDGYYVTVQRSDLHYVVTNYRPEEEHTNPTSPISTTVPTTNPTVPTTSPNTPDLPQTGQLWWPVTILSFAGVICIAIGFAVRKKH